MNKLLKHIILITIITTFIFGGYYIKYRLIRNKSKEKHFFTTYNKMQKLFQYFNIEYVSNGGTLIGAVRDSRFLPWDYDMDFCTDYKNENILCSNEFKRKAKNLKLDIEGCLVEDWKPVGGLKISNEGKWEMGQIDMFFFSNTVDEDIYYIGNDGHPHMSLWGNENYKKKIYFHYSFLNLNFQL